VNPQTKRGKLSKRTVNYRLATTGKRCGNCSMYVKPDVARRHLLGSCTLVGGTIQTFAVCDRWAAK